MAKPKRSKALRVLGVDTSMSSPGFAVIEVIDRKPKVTALFHVKTDTKDNYAQRTQHIEYYSYAFFREQRPIDTIVRENFDSKNSKIEYSVFSSWSAVDRALHHLGMRIELDAMPPSEIKRLVTGRGKAEKWEVEEAVRRITGYTGPFATNDESDACGIALAYLLKEELIDG